MNDTKTEWLSTGVPDVKPGHCKKYLVTIESQNGNRWVKQAQYANDHWMEWDDSYEGDDIDDNGGKKWTGWLEEAQDRYGDDLIMMLVGNVVAWMPMPAPFLANQELITKCV